MSVDLRVAATDYLAERRARGYRLCDHDWLITAFLDRLDARGITRINVADVLAFAQERPGTQLCWQATRLRVIQGLAAYIHLLDPSAAEVIPSGLIKAKTTRRIPYLYSDEQITQLMSKAASLSPPLLAAGIHTLIGLIAVTGLRSGEANALDVEDVCLSEQVMNVTGKYQKRRLVPLHATTVHALADYLEVRANRAAPAGPLFIGATGARLNLNKTRALFRFIVNDCGLQSRPGCGTPRLHDLRHTFAVNTLVDAHRRGDDIDARLAALVNYLGHVDPSSTYWYLTASAELMGIVSERIATYYERSRP